MQKYSTILLDIDDTLLDFQKSQDIALRSLFAWVGIPQSESNFKLYQEINERLWHEFEQNKISKKQIIDTRFILFFKKIGFSPDREGINERYLDFLSENAYFLPGAQEVCKYLSNKYQLFAVTNAIPRVQRPRLAKSGLEKYFDGIFISDEIGAGKPHKAFFDYVFSHIHEKDKSKILLIGDSYSSDIVGAYENGIDSIWINHDNRSVENIMTQSVKKIEEILEIL